MLVLFIRVFTTVHSGVWWRSRSYYNENHWNISSKTCSEKEANRKIQTSQPAAASVPSSGHLQVWWCIHWLQGSCASGAPSPSVTEETFAGRSAAARRNSASFCSSSSSSSSSDASAHINPLTETQLLSAFKINKWKVSCSRQLHHYKCSWESKLEAECISNIQPH